MTDSKLAQPANAEHPASASSAASQYTSVHHSSAGDPLPIRLRRSWRSLLLWLIPAGIAAVAGIYTAFETTAFDAELTLPGTDLQIRLPLFLLLFLVLLSRPMFLRRDTRTFISAHHLTATSGLMSLRRRDTSIPFEDLRGVQVRQSLWERIIDSGTLIAWSVSSEQPEIRCVGIAHPHRFAAVIKERIDTARIGRKAAGPYSS